MIKKLLIMNFCIKVARTFILFFTWYRSVLVTFALILEVSWVRGLKATELGFEFRDRSSNPIECQITITDDGLTIVP